MVLAIFSQNYNYVTLMSLLWVEEFVETPREKERTLRKLTKILNEYRKYLPGTPLEQEVINDLSLLP